ncbi:MAG: cysteinyl-tRNA synthetase, partial [Roseivirga sp.]
SKQFSLFLLMAICEEKLSILNTKMSSSTYNFRKVRNFPKVRELQKLETMQPEKLYHIYNHANGFENLFREVENYRYFLRQWEKHIQSIADSLAYCLMPNHFHFLIKVKDQSELEATFGKFETFQKLEYHLSKQFSLFLLMAICEERLSILNTKMSSSTYNFRKVRNFPKVRVPQNLTVCSQKNFITFITMPTVLKTFSER